MGHLEGWAFGCDICQEVCPWNRKAPPGREPALQPDPATTRPDLVAWLETDPAELTRQVQGTALGRARGNGLRRNAACVLGEAQDRTAVPALRRASDDPDAGVRQAARWALDRLASDDEVDADHHCCRGDQNQQDHEAEPRGVAEDARPRLVP
jgi:epoxyqueuosine reductase